MWLSLRGDLFPKNTFDTSLARTSHNILVPTHCIICVLENTL